MRPIYFLLRITLPYVMRIYYRYVRTLNSQKKLKTPTLFVCNHPSAFIDPLVAANFQWPIFHFMVRSDVFKPWLRPVTWSSHMVPIYRMAEDGKDSMEKNIDSFKAAIQILKKRHSLIMFGEGYTDDVFIRSLKPIKKGPARIAFSAMETTNWEQDILVQPMGLNYTHPKYFRSDVVVAMSDIIHLKDYKSLFEESSAKAITQLTRDIEKAMQEQITFVVDKNRAPFVEHIQMITRKGMNHFCSYRKISLEKRYHYSKKIANFINNNYNSEDQKWTSLESELKDYFSDLSKNKVNENWVYQFDLKKSKNLLLRWLYLICFLPVFLIGLVHNFIPYFIVKTFVEKIFKREVFWSGVKMLLGAFVIALYNLPIFWLFYEYVYPSYWLAFAYYITVPAFSLVIGYSYFNKLVDTFKIMRTPKNKIEEFFVRRNALKSKIDKLNFD